MATYAELLAIATAGDGTTTALRTRIAVAIPIACEAIRTEAVGTANHAARVAWAGKVIQNPGAYVDQVLWAVLAQNNTATTSQILNATDATVQTGVNNAVNLLAGGTA